MIYEIEKLFTPKGKENYDRWVAAHKLVCDCQGVTLHFRGGAIGTTVSINCPTLKDHDLTDYDSW